VRSSCQFYLLLCGPFLKDASSALETTQWNKSATELLKRRAAMSSDHWKISQGNHLQWIKQLERELAQNETIFATASIY
jgi:hypothetical protein